MHFLHSDLETLLTSNAYARSLSSIVNADVRSAMFHLKIEETQRVIQKAVERSTDTILLHVCFPLAKSTHIQKSVKLDAGPHTMIRDDDIQALWKGM